MATAELLTKLEELRNRVPMSSEGKPVTPLAIELTAFLIKTITMSATADGGITINMGGMANSVTIGIGPAGDISVETDQW